MNGIGSIKALITIQLDGYMHIVNPVTSLWGAVSKGKSGTFQFFAKNLDTNNMSEKCACVNFEDLFNKIQIHNDSTYEKSYLENTTCELGRSKRILDLIFVSTNGYIDQYFFVLKYPSKFNADVRILKEYKWKKTFKYYTFILQNGYFYGCIHYIQSIVNNLFQ